MMTEIEGNLARIRDRIARAAERTGRSPESITLVAVTKTVAPERIAAAYAAGLRDFGENYVQEALTKIATPPLAMQDMRWHFIGHLQTNKVREVEGRFALIQSVDSLRLAEVIGRRAVMAERRAAMLLEVKLDPLATKFGLAPEQTLQTATAVQEIPGVALQGLMGMASYTADAHRVREQFRRLASLFAALPEACRRTLSMGMTGDFEIAIEEGATMVRIGTGLFGSRP